MDQLVENLKKNLKPTTPMTQEEGKIELCIGTLESSSIRNGIIHEIFECRTWRNASRRSGDESKIGHASRCESSLCSTAHANDSPILRARTTRLGFFRPIHHHERIAFVDSKWSVRSKVTWGGTGVVSPPKKPRDYQQRRGKRNEIRRTSAWNFPRRMCFSLC